ncbi:MAG: hypothetical protein AAGC72_15255 [Planctomycetota bacterium]
MLIHASILNPDKSYGGRDISVGLRPRFQLQDSLVRMKPSSCGGVRINQLNLDEHTRRGSVELHLPEELESRHQDIQPGMGYVLLDGTKIIGIGSVTRVDRT